MAKFIPFTLFLLSIIFCSSSSSSPEIFCSSSSSSPEESCSPAPAFLLPPLRNTSPNPSKFTTMKFTYSRSSQTKFTLLGEASFGVRSVTLTRRVSNCSTELNTSVGQLLYGAPVEFVDSLSNNTVSFSTRFSFSIVPDQPPCLPCDGITFIIMSGSANFSHSDGFIGLPENSSTFLAVEFDNTLNPDVGDINDNHVGIDLGSIISVASVDLMTAGIDLKAGKRLTAWIEYRHPGKLLRVWVGSNARKKPENPILKMSTDYQFSEFMNVGFTGSNGRGSALISVHDWRFTTFKVLVPNKREPIPTPTPIPPNQLKPTPNPLNRPPPSPLDPPPNPTPKSAKKYSLVSLILVPILVALVSLMLWKYRGLVKEKKRRCQ